MQMNEKCLPCLVNQVVKIAEITGASQRTDLYQKVFAYLSQMDFTRTNPEIIGDTFAMVKRHLHHEDPYRQLRHDYNALFLRKMDDFRSRIHSFEEAVKYAIVGNVIDFNPMHRNVEKDIDHYFSHIDQLTLTINDVSSLKKAIGKAKTLLYLGDNCGEICLDMLLMEQMKAINPDLNIYFGVRGVPVVNDNIEADAYFVGMDQYAAIISNGDASLGTVLEKTSPAFQKVYADADVIISKGQANFESLSEQRENIYFLLMIKCAVISQYIGAPEKSLICLKNKLHQVSF